ncbi:hypothetical protein LguiA_031928 [Lonicera macranthoides]
MAGTLQTLNLKPPAPGIPHSRRRYSYLSPAGVPFSGELYAGARHSSPSFHWKLRSNQRILVRAIARSDQGNDDGENQPTRKLGLEKVSSWGKPLLNFLSNNFLPVALISGVALGLANPTLGCLADRYHLSKFSTFGIFIISGLTLRSEEIGAAAEAWPVGLFGLV